MLPLKKDLESLNGNFFRNKEKIAYALKVGHDFLNSLNLLNGILTATKA